MYHTLSTDTTGHLEQSMTSSTFSRFDLYSKSILCCNRRLQRLQVYVQQSWLIIYSDFQYQYKLEFLRQLSTDTSGSIYSISSRHYFKFITTSFIPVKLFTNRRFHQLRCWQLRDRDDGSNQWEIEERT